MAKIGRNSQCPCSSGKKYKKCCGSIHTIPPKPVVLNALDKLKSLSQHELLHRLGRKDIQSALRQVHEELKAKTLLREQQQGLGRPIISTQVGEYRVVAVGNTVYHSKEWKTFHDFLFEYIKVAMGVDWGNEEINKQYEERHPILQWYHWICSYKLETVKESGKISNPLMIGVVEIYLQLAYYLYLLAHNTIKNEFSKKLQDRLISRLKNLETFPGAYYECYVCANLIRAGFEVEFEDELDPSSKHCDFNITNKATGQKYTVEAKAIRRTGALGATQNTAQNNLRASIRSQLYSALNKPSANSRIIFIDVNLPEKAIDKAPLWVEEAVQIVEEAVTLTVNRSPTEAAYVILTNHPHHYHLMDSHTGSAVVAVGYKIPDFGHGKEFKSFRDIYHAKQKHIEIHNLINSLKIHYDAPSTFDGSLPSETFHGKPNLYKIGSSHFFEEIGNSGSIATITTATISKAEKLIYLGTDNGHVIRRPISDEELEDYMKFPDVFFGVEYTQGKSIDDPYEMFEWLLRSYSKTPKKKLLEFMKEWPDFEKYKSITQEELALIYCEGCVLSLLQNNMG